VRRRVLIGLAAVVAVLGLAVALRPSDRGDRYVALGDSYAAGVGAADLDGYAPRFAQWLEAGHGHRIPTFLNMGIGGESTASLLEKGQLERAIDAIADDDNRTRIVTLNIGTNELLAPECLEGAWMPRCTFKQNFTAIVDELQAALRAEPARSELLVMGLFTPFPDAGPIALRSVRYLLQGLDGRVDCAGRGSQIGMNDMIACIGARHGATFVDTYTPFRRGPRDLISPDGLHPSDAGYAVIARAFARAVADPPPTPPHAAAYR
jgi:lysophospholipase L1-like esterase